MNSRIKQLIRCGMVMAALLWLVGCAPSEDAIVLDYDQRTQQQPITRHGQLDSAIAALEVVPFKDLDPRYLDHAGIDARWAQQLRKKTWYAIHGDERYRYLVGRFRIRDFMAHIATFQDPNVPIEAPDQHYLCIDQRVLHKLLDLMQWMDEEGLDHSQLMVNYGFRHPSLNTRISGAPKSRHQWGEAIDLIVGDVNRDGEVDERDKKPLLAILDTKIIGHGGGVGRYPHSQVIHMDVRGHRARWDHQTPPLPPGQHPLQ
jgi:hypothetical protein